MIYAETARDILLDVLIRSVWYRMC